MKGSFLLWRPNVSSKITRNRFKLISLILNRGPLVKSPTPLIEEEVPSETDDNGVERDANEGIDEAGQSTELSL